MSSRVNRTWQVGAAALLFVGFVGFVACEERVVAPVDVARVELEPQNMTLRAGATNRFEVRLFDASGNALSGRDVQWSLADGNVAAVANNGTVIAIAPGVTRVVARSGGHTGEANLQVTSSVVGSIEIDPPQAHVVFGTEMPLTARVLADDGTAITDRQLTWTSSASGIATVSGVGVVRGVGLGKTTIQAALDGVSGQSQVEVTPPAIQRIDVVPTASSLEIGESVQLAAVGALANGSPVPGLPFAWRSLNTNVAVVDGAGLVRAVGPGDTRIEAGFLTVTGSADVHVAPIRAARIDVTPAEIRINVAGRATLHADVRDAGGNELDRDPVWTSRAPAIATVAQDGVVTGIAPGQTWVTGELDAGRDSAFVIVEVRPITRVQVVPSGVALQIDQTIALSALLFTADGAAVDRPVAWESGNPSVATVSGVGLVTAKAAGVATIFATAEGVAGTASVTVGPPIAFVAVTPDPLKLRAGETGALDARALTADATEVPGVTFVWSTQDPQVATVSQTGIVTGVSAGKTEVRATFGGIIGRTQVEVAPPPVASVTVTPNPLALAFGAKGQLTAVARSPAGAVISGTVFTWTTGSAGVATVSQTGEVSGTGGGSTTITATAEGVAGTSSVTVTPPPFTSIDVRPDSVEINVAGTTTLSAVGISAGGDVPITVAWSSAATAIATVSSAGVVTGVAPGKTTIRAVNGSFEATAVVIVGRNVPTSVTISPDDFTLEQTKDRQLSAVVKNALGETLSTSVTWSSSAPGIASVNGSGRVTANLEGSAQIRAAAGNAQDVVVVTVPPAKVDRVVVLPSLVPSLPEGKTIQLEITIYDVHNHVVTRPVTWEVTTGKNRADVSSTGLVTGVREGIAVVRATVEGKSDTTTIVVTNLSPSPVPQ